MSADLLRRAAALMRDNASKAEPGRWKTWGMAVMADPLGTSHVDDAFDVADCHTPSITERRLHTGNADHIASWHPAVALAVADWLEDAAACWVWDEADEFPVYDHDGDLLTIEGSLDSRVLAIALTYLGEEADA